MWLMFQMKMKIKTVKSANVHLIGMVGVWEENWSGRDLHHTQNLGMFKDNKRQAINIDYGP